MDTMIHAQTIEAPRSEGFRVAVAKPQKAFAIAFAVLATALAGCASGLGANAYEPGQVGRIAHVEEGTVISVAGNAISMSAGARNGYAYTVRLPSGELVSIAQAGNPPIPTGTPVLIEYGERARVIPQYSGYSS